MTSTLAPVIRLPLAPRAKPGDRIRCTPMPPDYANFRTLLVCSTAFWQRNAQCRRYSNVVKEIRLLMDRGDTEEGLPPDPRNHAIARTWVDEAIAAKHSPLSVVAA